VAKTRIATLTALLLASIAVGCSKSPYDLAPVQGTVRIEGRPLTTGKVMFAPIAQGDNANAGKPAFGRIQSDGRYVLTTLSENDGAIVGEHWVTILDGEVPGMPPFPRLPVGQKQTVASGTNEIDIELSGQEAARYAAKGN
jgi:hypothetical protein